MALNAENGRLAQIVFDNPERISTAAISDITGSLTAESVLTAAMIWLENLGRRRKRPVLDICIVCEQRQAKNAQKLHALLNKKWKAKMTVFEIDRKHDPPRLNPLPARQISSLWREKAQRLTLPKESETSKTAATIRDMAPGIIDVLYSRNGETLRFLGLPFARVRITPESERAWFGLGRDRHLLTEATWPVLETLIGDLIEYRAADSKNKRHAYYRSSPEAWLESILRLNISFSIQT